MLLTGVGLFSRGNPGRGDRPPTFLCRRRQLSDRLAHDRTDLASHHPADCHCVVRHLAHLQDDNGERFNNALLRMVGLGAILTLPALSGSAYCPANIIPLLFGSKWECQRGHRTGAATDGRSRSVSTTFGPALAAIGPPRFHSRRSTGVQTVGRAGPVLRQRHSAWQWFAAAYVLRAILMLPSTHLFRRAYRVGLCP